MQLIWIAYIVTLTITSTSFKRNDPINKIILKSSQTPHSDEWPFDRTAGKLLKFKNGKTFNTGIYNLVYIGQIDNNDKAPFLIFSGRDCNECDANISIFIHSPSDGRLNVANGENEYSFPGVEKDIENNNPILKSRAFYGQVLPGIKGVIWYQNQLMENNSWQKTTFLVNVNTGMKKVITLKGQEKLKLTLQLLKQGLCKEIKGVEYSSEP